MSAEARVIISSPNGEGDFWTDFQIRPTSRRVMDLEAYRDDMLDTLKPTLTEHYLGLTSGAGSDGAGLAAFVAALGVREVRQT